MSKLTYVIFACLGLLVSAQNTNNPDVSNAQKQETAPKIDLNIYEVADVLPEFPGGTQLFRKNVEENIEFVDVEAPGYLESKVELVIEMDGSITGVKSNGFNNKFNKEVVRAVRSIKKKWKSAQLKGNPIRYKMYLPVKMYISSVQKL